MPHKKEIFSAFVLILAILGSCAAVALGEDWLNPNFIYGKINELPRLQKPHLSWPSNVIDLSAANRLLLKEHVRITGAVGYNLNFAKSFQTTWAYLDDLVEAYEAVPYVLLCPYDVLESSIAVGPERNLDVSSSGFLAHLEHALEAIELGRRHIRHPPRYVLLDTECFRTGSDYENLIVGAKLNLIYAAFRNWAPDSKILWFCYGCSGWKSDYYGWRRWPSTLPQTVLTDALSPGLYQPEQRYLTRELMKRAFVNADELGIESVIPWISFGYQTEYDLYGTVWTLVPPYGHRKQGGHPWSNQIAYELGWEIHRKLPRRASSEWVPWERVPATAGWPSAFVSGKPRPGYWENFYWYCRGAGEMRPQPGER
jgi:hypothetical protein